MYNAEGMMVLEVSYDWYIDELNDGSPVTTSVTLKRNAMYSNCFRPLRW
jgi:hypothetical protein